MDFSGSLAAFLVLSFAMGLRHGFDPDHIALIDGLARFHAKERRNMAQRCGMLFTAGHMIIVGVLVVLLSLALDVGQPAAWLEISGTVISATFLVAIGSLNLAAALKPANGSPVVPVGLKSRLFSQVSERLGVVGIGMLFALSFDTVSQAGLMAITGMQYGALAPLLAGLTFGAGMFVTAGLTSVWVARMSSRIDARAAVASRAITLVIGLISFGIAGLVAGSLFASPVAAWLDANGLWLSIGMTGTLAALFVFCLLVLRLPPETDGAV